MRQYERFFQMDAGCFTPFNEAPAYLRGSVRGTATDAIEITGSAEHQVSDWYKIGCKTCQLEVHSFAFSVDASPCAPIGAYSIGIHGDCSINVSHFLRSSVRLLDEKLAENLYSGWGYDNAGRRTQRGVAAPWESLGKRHALMVMYDAEEESLACFVNGFPIHSVRGNLNQFRLAIRFEAVGIAGDFSVEFGNICYYSLDSRWQTAVPPLKAWDPQYAPVFVSYSHADRDKVNPVVGELRCAGARVLGDWDFRPGDSLQQRISLSIERSGYLLVFLSPQSVDSPWVQQELEMVMARALRERRVGVLPIMLEDCEIPIFLADKLYVDLCSERRSGVEALLDTLRHHGSW